MFFLKCIHRNSSDNVLFQRLMALYYLCFIRYIWVSGIIISLSDIPSSTYISSSIYLLYTFNINISLEIKKGQYSLDYYFTMNEIKHLFF